MTPEEMKADIEKSVQEELDQEQFDKDENVKDELLYELSEKLDEAEEELARKEVHDPHRQHGPP